MTGYRAVQSTPLFDRNSGNPVGMLSTFFRKPHRSSARQLRVTDLYAKQAADVITSRVGEQCLRESEQHLRLALEAGHMGTWEWDSVKGLLKADAAHQAFFGLPAPGPPSANEVYWDTWCRRKFEKASKGLRMHSAAALS